MNNTDGTFGISYYDNKGNFTKYVEKGKDFDLIQVAQDEDTLEIYYDIRCDLLGKDNEFRVPKSIAVDSRKLLNYAVYGLDIDSSNMRIVTEIIRKKEDEYVYSGKNTISKVYSVAGVKETTDSNGNPITVYAGYSNPINNAQYIGPFDLQSRGSLEEWISFVREIVTDNVPLMFILASSFASIVLGFLKSEIDVDNLIVHLRNDSSSGKTTAEMLAISVFGSPEISSSSLISSWNSTKNALLRRCMNTNGITLGLDELSMLNDKNISNTIYSLATGIEKDRLTREAQVQERLTGNYVLISTGECSMLSKTNGNIGLIMRILEIDGVRWTKSAQESEYIKRKTRKNYGYGATEFGLELGKYVQMFGIDSLINAYESWRNYYQNVSCITERKERMSARIALILLAACIASQVLNIELDPYDICDFIVENEKKTDIDGKNNYNNFYDRFVAYINANQDHFKYKSIRDKTWKSASKSPVYGMIEDVSKENSRNAINGKVEEVASIVYVNEVDFNRICTKELGYEDTHTICAWLKKKNYSITESDRYYIRKMVDGARIKFVAVFVIGENKDNRMYQQGKNAASKRSKKKNNISTSKRTIASRKENQSRQLEKTLAEHEV